MINFEIAGDYIELIKLLKAAGIAESGSEAKLFVSAQKVKVNKVVDTRLRAKIRRGDVVEGTTFAITVV